MRWPIEIHVHRFPELDPVLAELKVIRKQQEKIMAISTETRAVIDRLNAATNKLAERLNALADQLKDAGMPKGDEDAAVAELQAIAGNLEGMGTSETAPIPPEPPVTPPAP